MSGCSPLARLPSLDVQALVACDGPWGQGGARCQAAAKQKACQQAERRSTCHFHRRKSIHGVILARQNLVATLDDDCPPLGFRMQAVDPARFVSEISRVRGGPKCAVCCRRIPVVRGGPTQGGRRAWSLLHGLNQLDIGPGGRPRAILWLTWGLPVETRLPSTTSSGVVLPLEGCALLRSRSPLPVF